MNAINEFPNFLDRRSGLDRRRGSDRRLKSLLFLTREEKRRSILERRKLDEDRNGWVRVSWFSSTSLGISTQNL